MAEFDPSKSDYSTVEEMMDAIRDISKAQGKSVKEVTKEYTQFDSWEEAQDAY